MVPGLYSGTSRTTISPRLPSLNDDVVPFNFSRLLAPSRVFRLASARRLPTPTRAHESRPSLFLSFSLFLFPFCTIKKYTHRSCTRGTSAWEVTRSGDKTHMRVGAQLSASAACRKLSMWHAPRVAQHSTALALACRASLRSFPHRAYATLRPRASRSSLGGTDRPPKRVHTALLRLPRPFALSLRSSLSSGPRFSLSRSPSLTFCCSLAFALSIRYLRATIPLSLSPPISILFPYFPLEVCRSILTISLFFSLFLSLFLFLRSPFASLLQIPLSFSFILFLYSRHPSYRHAIQSRLRVTEKVLQLLILLVLLAYDDARTRRKVAFLRIECTDFPLDPRAISKPRFISRRMNDSRFYDNRTWFKLESLSIIVQLSFLKNAEMICIYLIWTTCIVQHLNFIIMWHQS